MSEVIDTETKSYGEASNHLLTKAYQLAEQARIQSITKPLPQGGGFSGFSDDNLQGYAISGKPDYFVAVLYKDTTNWMPDPEDGRQLKNCQAWILKYDRQHARWSVEAWNGSIGNKAFAKLARRFLAD
ncbi:unnamed protein product [marine sediment metagenome]|uniref:Uncharacterized protein n=1 Tax=marine sediment metagenome TaxID=412755 RepID=X1SJT0_9ZZZZ